MIPERALRSCPASATLTHGPKPQFLTEKSPRFRETHTPERPPCGTPRTAGLGSILGETQNSRRDAASTPRPLAVLLPLISFA
ncbi:hypothetical protein Pla123a_30310 [Posidoniimonas polymericola]|uniref:Uncharacterized protein n=1 Tax=Posidoniimonas polymericola TaxID=2528002 RepID=A0A5C5YKZ5_9BACT|nr:hypothetical protein Pla123a_30310 [Posidoniimonas polymericola]